MHITVHRGNQIGGCITEISTATSRVFIDMGDNLPGKGALSSVEKQAYVNDIFARSSKRHQAVFYTHAHADHMGMMQYVPDGVEQYMSKGSKQHTQIKYHILVECAKIINSKTFEDEALRHLDILEKVNILDTKDDKQYKVGDITVIAYDVPHSAYGAVMLLVEADGKKIVHTGDFKREGNDVELLSQLDKIKQHCSRESDSASGVDILITEGTMLNRSQTISGEAEIESRMNRIFKDKRTVFVLTSSLNYDRISSTLNAAKDTGKPVVVCSAMMKGAISVYNSNDNSEFFFSVSYYPFKDSEYENSGISVQDRIDLDQKNLKLIRWIEDKGCIVIVGAGQVDKVRTILKDFSHEDCFLIYSVWKGYYEKEEQVRLNPQYKAMRDLFLSDHIYDIHSSGHADRETIAETIKSLNPQEAIIGIHKEPESSLHSLDISEDLKRKIIQDDKTVEWVKFD